MSDTLLLGDDLKRIELDEEFKKLKNAWQKGKISEIQRILSGRVNLHKNEVEEFLKLLVTKTGDDDNYYKSPYKVYWEILFQNNVHRKTFQNGTSLVRCLVEGGNSKVLKLLLDHEPNMRQVGVEGNASLHYLSIHEWGEDVEKIRSYEECMRLLAYHPEIDINALNFNYDTPIELALEKENRRAIEILLKSSKIIYLGKNGLKDQSVATPYELLEREYSDIPLPDKSVSTNENVMAYSKLYVFLRRRMKDEFQNELTKAMNNKIFAESLVEKLHILLQEACRQKLKKIVNSLLNYGADPSKIDVWNDSRSAIVAATENGKIELLPILLERASLINFKLDNVREKCDVKKINKKDEEGNTALHYAVDHKHEAAMLDILVAGGGFGIENAKKQIALTRIPAKVLKKFLDERIKKTDDEGDNGTDGIIEFDCRFMEQPNVESLSGVMLLEQMRRKREQRKLLSHPVLAAFALKTWDKMRIVYFLNLIFYMILCAVMTFNTVWTSLYGKEYLLSTRILQGVLLLVLLIRESFQAFIQKRHFLTEYANYLELSIVTIGGYLSISGCGNDPILCRHLGAVVVLFCWLGLLLLIGKHPFFAVNVEMFLLVLSSFVKILSLFLIMILAFAMSFFVLFHECTTNSCPNEFSDVSTSVFKTLLMVSGEFDAPDIPFRNYPGTSHFIFILFVFLIAIVLLNLLNGLAVYDTQKIQEDACLLCFAARVQYLASLEELLLGLKTFGIRLRNKFSIENYVIKLNASKKSKKKNFCSKQIHKVIICLQNLSSWYILKEAQKILDSKNKASVGNNRGSSSEPMKDEISTSQIWLTLCELKTQVTQMKELIESRGLNPTEWPTPR